MTPSLGRDVTSFDDLCSSNKSIIMRLLLLLCMSAYLATAFGQTTAMRQLGPDMQVLGLTENTLIHRSFLYLDNGARVPCNGLVYIQDSLCIVFDTPVDVAATTLLLDYLQERRNLTVIGVVVNHAHVDCVGGLSVFHERGITSYASKATIELCRAREKAIPQKGFGRRQKIKIHKTHIINYAPGHAHAPDNIVSYIPEEKVLFGGCMVKAYGAGKGNLDDADTVAWPRTIAKVKKKFRHAEHIVPGHSYPGGPELLDYTIELFDPSK